MKTNKKKKDEQSKRRDLIIEIILVAIIIALFLHNCELSKQNQTHNVNTGNVHIIEIKCNTSNVCEPVEPNKPNNNGKNNNGNKGNNGGSSEENIEGEAGLDVYDIEMHWDGVTEAKIFTNSMYTLEGKIAPESSNTYQFVVKNGNNYRLKYDISFVEDNPYNANMKYKLKKNDTYVISEYVSADELMSQNNILEANNYDTFYLEWKWVSNSNDTEVGRIDNATYGLKIEVKAESIND